MRILLPIQDPGRSTKVAKSATNAWPPHGKSGSATIGILDNSKAHARLVLENIADRLVGSQPGTKVIYARKTHPSIPMDESHVRALRDADLVLTGLGD